MKLEMKWSLSNSKLKQTGTVSFNLPARLTCPGADKCKAVCYACQGRYNMPAVKRSRAINYQRSRGPLFLRRLINDLRTLANAGRRSVRIHDSGDFYRQEYLDAWKTAARMFPAIRFYAYTKSLHLNWRMLPANFHVVQSLGGKFDARADLSKPHARIFDTHDARVKAGYADGTGVDLPAVSDTVRIGLVYHGQRKAGFTGALA